MKIEREFIYTNKKHADGYPQIGWLIHDKPHFDPIQNRPHVLVHDILEHTNYDGDSLEDELMALGATYFFRVYGGWIRFTQHWEGERGHWVQHSDIFTFVQQNDFNVKPIKGDIHPDLDYYMELSRKKVLHRHYKFRDVFESNPGLIRDIFKWVSRGYVRAMNQWAGHDAETVYLKVWEPMWRALGGHHDTYQEMNSNMAEDWSVVGNRMVITMDTATLAWSIDFKGKTIQQQREEDDALLDELQAA